MEDVLFTSTICCVFSLASRCSLMLTDAFVARQNRKGKEEGKRKRSDIRYQTSCACVLKLTAKDHIVGLVVQEEHIDFF